jgi:hypothetical protein
LKKLILAALTVSVLAGAAPAASAHPWHHHWRHHCGWHHGHRFCHRW